jgi:hypothetical protein
MLKNMLSIVRYGLTIFIFIIGILPCVSQAAVRNIGPSSVSSTVATSTPGARATTTTAEGFVSSTTSSFTALATSSVGAPDFIVGPSDLARVFTVEKQLVPANGRFEGPVRYFRVKEHLTHEEAPRDCDDCDTLVAVFVSSVMPTSTPAWVATANPEIRRAGGRLQVRWFAANRLIIVTAPGTAEMVTAVGSWLRERAILGKIN